MDCRSVGPTPLGQVCVSITPTTLTVTYPDLGGGSYTDLHVTVQTSPITQPNQGKWEYTKGNGACTISGGTATCSIKVLPEWQKCDTTLYIGVHASFTAADGSGNTGWGTGKCIESRPNCPKYFEFNTKCECKVVTTYDPVSTEVSIVTVLKIGILDSGYLPIIILVCVHGYQDDS